MTTTTTTTTTALWFHDAIDQDEIPTPSDYDNNEHYCCENCRITELQEQWQEHLRLMHQYKYGLCIDCGAGLNYENEFLVDRRETQCDSFTCDACFIRFHGKDSLHEAVNWKKLGKPIPQFVRLDCLYSS